MESAGVITLLNENSSNLLEEENLKISLSGAPYNAIRDKKDSCQYYNLKHVEADLKIGVFHQMILPDSQSFFSEYINFEDLKEVNSDIIIDGHYHVGFTPSRINIHDKHFINGGSLSRGSSEQFNLEKEPSFVELSITKGDHTIPFIIDHKDIVVPHKPASEIFDLDKVERRKELKGLKEFINNLSEFEKESLSAEEPEGIIRILKTMAVPEQLIPIADDYLTKAYEKLY